VKATKTAHRSPLTAHRSQGKRADTFSLTSRCILLASFYDYENVTSLRTENWSLSTDVKYFGYILGKE
jgi:hypothetical protein